MASRLGVSRATTYIQLRFWHAQDLVSTGVVRLWKVPAKDNLAHLHTKFRPVTLYYNLHAIMQHGYLAQLAHHYRMNNVHGYILLAVAALLLEE